VAYFNAPSHLALSWPDRMATGLDNCDRFLLLHRIVWGRLFCDLLDQTGQLSYVVLGSASGAMLIYDHWQASGGGIIKKKGKRYAVVADREN
jgi:hypothetical protein